MYESKDTVQMGKKIEIINKDMQLILFSLDIWVLHANIVLQCVTPKILENKRRGEKETRFKGKEDRR